MRESTTDSTYPASAVTEFRRARAIDDGVAVLMLKLWWDETVTGEARMFALRVSVMNHVDGDFGLSTGCRAASGEGDHSTERLESPPVSVAPWARRSRAASGTCSGSFRARLVFAALSGCSVALEPFANILSDRGSSKLRAAVLALCPRGPAWPPRGVRRESRDSAVAGTSRRRVQRACSGTWEREGACFARIFFSARAPTTQVQPQGRRGCCSRTSGDSRDSAGDVVVQQQYQRTSVRPSRLTARREGTKRYV